MLDSARWAKRIYPCVQAVQWFAHRPIRRTRRRFSATDAFHSLPSVPLATDILPLSPQRLPDSCVTPGQFTLVYTVVLGRWMRLVPLVSTFGARGKLVSNDHQSDIGDASVLRTTPDCREVMRHKVHSGGCSLSTCYGNSFSSPRTTGQAVERRERSAAMRQPNLAVEHPELRPSPSVPDAPREASKKRASASAEGLMAEMGGKRTFSPAPWLQVFCPQLQCSYQDPCGHNFLGQPFACR